MDTALPPIGLALSKTAKAVTRGFETCLGKAGGSLSTWLILQALMAENGTLQAALAQVIGVQGPTLTHHLNGLEAAGLITRTRLISDRRSHRVDVTEAGRAMFLRLRQSAMAYDAVLNGVLPATAMEQFRRMMEQLAVASQNRRDELNQDE